MLTINLEGLEKKVKPEMANSKKYLKLSRESISAISIPSDFTYYSRLKSMPTTISNIETEITKISDWIEEIIKSFTIVEKDNNNLVDSIIETYNNILKNVDSGLNGISSYINSKVNEKSDEFTETGEKLSKDDNSALVAIGNVFSELAEDIKSGELIVDIKEYAAKTCATIGSEISYAIESLGEGLKKVGATVANGVIGVVKGLAELIQSLLKGISLIAVAGSLVFSASSIATVLQLLSPIGVVGIELYKIYKENGGDTTKIDKFIADSVILAKGTLDALLQGVMGFIAEDYVGNAFDWFYTTDVGQTLDEYAFSPFKSDGVGTQIISGVGYVGGIIAISIATAGIGGIAAGATTAISGGSTVAVSAATAGIAGFGKYTSEKWAEFRDESWEGINRLYEKGDITEAQYNSFVYIRGLTDEGWTEIEQAYKNGEIGEEEFALMRKIRELPEDWATVENAFKGIAYGAASGLWESVQWYLGGKLSSFALKGASNLTNSAIRVGVDSAFNMADTPYRALIDSVTTGKDYEQAWIEQGGWQAMLSNLGIGMIGSVGGEVFDSLGGKINKKTGLSNEIYSISNVDDVVSLDALGSINTIDDAIILTLKKQGLPITKENIQFIRNKINAGDFSYITRANGARDKVKELLKQADISSGSINTIDDAIILTLRKQGIPVTPEEMSRLRNKIYSGDYKCITRMNGARDKVKELTGKIKRLVDVLNTGDTSDPRVVNMIQDSFEKWMGGNLYAEKLANQLIKLKQKYPALTFGINPDGGSYWNGSILTLRLGVNQVKWGDSGTLAHETGHLLFSLVLDEELPDNWNNIVAKSRVLSSNINNGKLMSMVDNLQKSRNQNYDKARELFIKEIRKKGYRTQAEFIQELERYLNKVGMESIIDLFKKEGIGSDIIDLIKDPNITPKDVATAYANGKISAIAEKLDRLKEGGSDCAISDIICSVYEGTHRDLNGKWLSYTYGHSQQYYSQDPLNAFHEIIANFTKLKISGNTKALEQIKNIFGDEFYFKLEETFNKLLE